MALSGPRKLTPEVGWLWEDSRRLPGQNHPHDRARQLSARRPKAELDEEQWCEIERIIELSMKERVQVKISLYDPRGQHILFGAVESVHEGRRRFLFDGRWYDIGDIEEAAIMEPALEDESGDSQD